MSDDKTLLLSGPDGAVACMGGASFVPPDSERAQRWWELVGSVWVHQVPGIAEPETSMGPTDLADPPPLLPRPDILRLPPLDPALRQTYEALLTRARHVQRTHPSQAWVLRQKARAMEREASCFSFLHLCD
jgi:hypothetical protein